MSTFEIVRGPEGDCLLLDDTRISGPKPWGGGTVTKTFHTDGSYAVVPKAENDRLKAENAKLRREFELDMFCGAGEIESYKREASVAVKHAAQAESENAKLRELVDYMTPIAWYAASKRERDRMRELGIEVCE